MENVWLAVSVQWDDCSVALGAPGGPIRVHRASDPGVSDQADGVPGDPVSGRVASRDVLVLVDAALQAAGLEGRALAGLVYASGPGAFTALRVGAAIVQGLARAWDKPVRTIDSLTAMTSMTSLSASSAVEAGAPQEGPSAWLQVSALDARMGEIYYAVHACTRDATSRVLRPPAVAAAEVALPEIARIVAGAASAPAPALVCAGRVFNQVPVLADWATARRAILRGGGGGEPDAGVVLEAALRPGGPPAGDPRDAKPLYVRDKVALDRDEQRQAALRRTESPARAQASGVPSDAGQAGR